MDACVKIRFNSLSLSMAIGWPGPVGLAMVVAR